MLTVYITLIGILFLLAISDLIVGVSNDAVNFLNSAIGSQAAPFKVIMIIATVGILVGATFSGGMMEVARRGIFHPQEFFFAEIIVIFLAVMITDVILLDLFNTFGMPTSTTVSIVFELLGAAVAISIIKIYTSDQGIGDLSEYINSSKALAIISGILSSVVIAFTIGAIVQYIARIIFTFNYKRKLNYFGGVWGGFAITAITYFILIKGAKGTTFMTADNLLFIEQNAMLIVLISFIFWSVLLQVLYWVFKINILKIIVLIGTFALAMAFAGNDLVNFIGVPLAGYESFQEFIANPDAQPDNFMMTSLQSKVKTPTLFLILAGIIMTITLWFSKKARSVTKTEVDLGRQNEGSERFGSTAFSRAIVQISLTLSKYVGAVVPTSFQIYVRKRFEPIDQQNTLVAELPSFDMIRASVNLVVASILIAFATSLKLPLSTTYVTFMVAMGSSLSDKAWGRESAVYRITGVLSVIGGWFFTAFFAFTVAFLTALLFSFTAFYGIIFMLIIAGITIYRTHIIHKKRSNKKSNEENLEKLSDESILQFSESIVTANIQKINNYYAAIIENVSDENLKKMKKVFKKIKELNSETKELKYKLNSTISKLQEESFDSVSYYVQVLDYLRELAHNLNFIAQPAYEHLSNHHKNLTDVQLDELLQLKEALGELLTGIANIIQQKNYADMNQLLEIQKQFLANISSFNKNQIKRIKKVEVGTKNSMLYLAILSESKNLSLNAINLLKSQRDMHNSHRGVNV